MTHWCAILHGVPTTVTLLPHQVWNTPHSHVTRDYKEGVASLGDLTFTVVDTSGLEPFAPSGCIQHRATALTTRVLRRADIMLLMLDGRYAHFCHCQCMCFRVNRQMSVHWT